MRADEHHAEAEAGCPRPDGAEEALASVAALALDRLAEVGQLRRERDALRDAWTRAVADVGRLSAEVERLAALEEAASRLRPLEAEVDRLRFFEGEAARLRPFEAEAARLRGEQARAELHLRAFETHHAARRQQLEAVVRSATWRLARPAHRAVEAIPLAHRLLRLGRRLGSRLVRATRRRGGAPRA